MVAECVVSTTDLHGLLPPVTTRRKLSKAFAGLHYEHILIFTDRARQNAVWLWPKREDGKTKTREHTYRKGQPGDLLLSKLAGIAFGLEELDDAGRASIAEVGERVTRAFDVERITRRFYDTFKVEHDHFQEFLTGVKDSAHQAWYTSVMLNRLMFLYFVQKKGFLNANVDYLRTKLTESQQRGPDRFYRDFLLILFFEGLACEPRERSAATNALLGTVPYPIPYLNGGIFMPHQIEEANPGIELPDAAFERLFDFFDRYTWHLDDRPLRADNEINPDVLGFIFEKYINQKQMGAYYTKEDITDYICKYTILPFLLDKIGLNIAQELTSIDPLIYDAVKTPDYLPTETEREYTARQKRYEQIGLDFAAGMIATVNDLITYNLDIRTFADDWLSHLDAPTMLRRFYAALTELTVLDPTCGSGAFLFAAMNILEPLYEGCLRKMEMFVARPDGHAFGDFQTELDRVRAHPNERYFIFKSIIVNNLYGVDIMDEAVEICKLRLFLKLVAQVSDVRRIEPLPDIDFNIRAGNTLVGFATEAEINADMFAHVTLPQIKTMAGTLRTFRQQQLQTGIAPATMKTLKKNVREKQGEIAATLDKALMDQYGQTNLDAFRASHKPFHWYAEYNGVMANGGFDVIVGNPPYVEYSKIRKEYTIRGYLTEDSGNLYAYTMERAIYLQRTQGRFGVIIPVGAFSVDETASLRSALTSTCSMSWTSSYAIRPSKLFDGVDQRLAIYITKKQKPVSDISVFMSDYYHWHSEAREQLFSLVCYQDVSDLAINNVYPKAGDQYSRSIIEKVVSQQRVPAAIYLQRIEGAKLYYHRSPRYWIRTIDFEPYFKSATRTRSIHHVREINAVSIEMADFLGAIFNSSLFFFWFISVGNGRNLTGDDIKNFPVGSPSAIILEQISGLFKELMADYKLNSFTRIRKDQEYQEFNISASKPIIDEIDRVLAHHYGFTDEELDFIINYDIKYRMGRDAESEDEGGE
jgi:hypothetical protein